MKNPFTYIFGNTKKKQLTFDIESFLVQKNYFKQPNPFAFKNVDEFIKSNHRLFKLSTINNLEEIYLYDLFKKHISVASNHINSCAFQYQKNIDYGDRVLKDTISFQNNKITDIWNCMLSFQPVLFDNELLFYVKFKIHSHLDRSMPDKQTTFQEIYLIKDVDLEKFSNYILGIICDYNTETGKIKNKINNFY
jgi:hypothetical protein